VTTQTIFAGTSLAVFLTGGTLIALLLAFLSLFFVPGVSRWIRLGRIHRDIQRDVVKLEPKKRVEGFKQVFSADHHLAHLWKEYRESLHPYEELDNGQLAIVQYRATAPAEMYFNGQSVVDGRLHTEFFKHLPGVFTGVGIIGTFSGLIQGLRIFRVSESPVVVRGSLESLMHSVGEAFLVSASAICAAMVVTLLEKVLLNALYRRTDEIVRLVDASFESGVGEHYLGRLVRASEDSASQSKILKDALVKELGELLRELTSAQISAAKEQQEQLATRLAEASRQQVEAARQDNQALGETIADSIKQSLHGPLQDIAETVKSASGDQSASAVRMLQDVMASFSQRLNDLFGGQITGLSELNQQTAQSIQSAVGALQALVANMEDSSRRSTDTMAERMAEAIEKMEARQEAINIQSAAFVEQIRALVESSQSETQGKLQAVLEEIGTRVNTMLETLDASQKQVFENNREREQSMAERAGAAVGTMTESVELVVKELRVATEQMAKNISTLTQTTASSVEKMNAGAEHLGRASSSFAAAGDRVSSVMDKAGAVTTKLAETSGALTVGGTALQELIKDYRLQRTQIEVLVSELRATVEVARKEASLTADILGRIEGSAHKLGAAQKQAEEYLDGVNRVLAEAHTSFATQMKKTLDTANTEFHSKLSTAVGMLHSAVSELELTLAAMGTLTPTKK
jgi:hypothetical protein